MPAINWELHRNTILKLARTFRGDVLAEQVRLKTGMDVSRHQVLRALKRYEKQKPKSLADAYLADGVAMVNEALERDVWQGRATAKSDDVTIVINGFAGDSAALGEELKRRITDAKPDKHWSTSPFKPGQVYRVLVIPDMQVPYEDKESVAAVEKYMADVRYDEVIILGDFLDLDCISSHNAKNLRAIEGKSIQADYDYANALLDRWQRIVRKRNPDARWVLLEGNHEYRAERYLDEHPQLRGLLEVERGLRLKERGFKWVRCYAKGEVYKLGKAHFHHGLYCGSNHARKMVENFGVNIFYGHTHDVIEWPKTTYGEDSTIIGKSLGCLCGPQPYMNGRPDNWQQAVTDFFFTDDGFFNHFVSRIFQHRLIAPNGKVYDGRN